MGDKPDNEAKETGLGPGFDPYPIFLHFFFQNLLKSQPPCPRPSPFGAGAFLRSFPGLASEAAAASRQLPPAEGDSVLAAIRALGQVIWL